MSDEGMREAEQWMTEMDAELRRMVEENPELAQMAARKYQRLRYDQRVWQRQREATWQRASANESASATRVGILALEWAAIRVCQAIELGWLSPVALARLRDALGTADDLDTYATQPERRGAMMDYVAESQSYYGVDALWDDHADWLERQSRARSLVHAPDQGPDQGPDNDPVEEDV